MREQQEQLQKLAEYGLETQKQVTNLSKYMGAKITTNELLDKSQLKKILNKKGEAMKRTDTNRSIDLDLKAMIKPKV